MKGVRIYSEEIDEMNSKQNKIIEWINERDEERIEEYELMRKWIDKINKWINEHEKSGEKNGNEAKTTNSTGKTT